MPRRVAISGAELQMLVLAADARGCVGVDLDSGAFVRASHPGHDERMAEAFDIVTGRIAGGDPPDASRPETVTLAAPPRVTGRLSGRRAERYLSALHHPPRGPLLGFTGRAIPYWTLNGDRPSVTLVGDIAGPQLRLAPAGYECSFTWQGARHQFVLGDRTLTAELRAVGWPRYSSRDLQTFLGYRVRRLLVVLTPPHDGYCYKLVAALLPGG
jgi:hypothetical protein